MTYLYHMRVLTAENQVHKSHEISKPAEKKLKLNLWLSVAAFVAMITTAEGLQTTNNNPKKSWIQYESNNDEVYR